MSSVGNQILENFKTSKEYRHAFVEEKVRTWIAGQIKAIREHQGIKRPELARMMGKSPSWVFRLEDANQPPPTISTLLQVAEAYDVDLDIRFTPFSALINDLDRISPNSFTVPSFSEEFDKEAPLPKPAERLDTGLFVPRVTRVFKVPILSWEIPQKRPVRREEEKVLRVTQTYYDYDLPATAVNQ